MTALELLRKLQWRADGYSCIGCGAMHRDGCKSGCELAPLLAQADALAAEIKAAIARTEETLKRIATPRIFLKRSRRPRR